MHPPRIHLERPGPSRAREFLAAVERCQDGSYEGHLVIDEHEQLAGVINISEIVRGALQSGYLGYYAFAPHQGRGIMQLALRQVVSAAFGAYGLHRLEANIQPDNLASRTLVQKLGFQLEGYSPRYLKIRGRWRDHERWAITREMWPRQDKRRN
jgi:[ribosomal protein S5]-alanine N-acetyltransferase